MCHHETRGGTVHGKEAVQGYLNQPSAMQQEGHQILSRGGRKPSIMIGSKRTTPLPSINIFKKPIMHDRSCPFPLLRFSATGQQPRPHHHAADHVVPEKRNPGKQVGSENSNLRHDHPQERPRPAHLGKKESQSKHAQRRPMEQRPQILPDLREHHRIPSPANSLRPKSPTWSPRISPAMISPPRRAALSRGIPRTWFRSSISLLIWPMRVVRPFFSMPDASGPLCRRGSFRSCSKCAMSPR